MNAPEGWMHDCPTKKREVWWPWGQVLCQWCGKRRPREDEVTKCERNSKP